LTPAPKWANLNLTNIALMDGLKRPESMLQIRMTAWLYPHSRAAVRKEAFYKQPSP